MAFPTQSASLVQASSQYLSHANVASLQFTGSFTLEGWFKFTTFTSVASFPGEMLSKYGGGSNQRAYYVGYRNNAGTLQFVVAISSDGTGPNTNTGTLNVTLTTGTWYHIAWAFNAALASCEIIVNGASQGTITGLKNSVFASSSAFDIGTADGELTSTTFDGKASLVRAWSTNLSAATINANKCLVLGPTTNLVAEWTLDNTLADDSGNALTLTNNNSAMFSADVTSVCFVPNTGGAFFAAAR